MVETKIVEEMDCEVDHINIKNLESYCSLHGKIKEAERRIPPKKYSNGR